MCPLLIEIKGHNVGDKAMNRDAQESFVFAAGLTLVTVVIVMVFKEKTTDVVSPNRQLLYPGVS